MPDYPPVQTPEPEAHPDLSTISDQSRPAAAEQTIAAGPEVYDSKTLRELEDIFGRPKLLDLLGRLGAEITQRLQAPDLDRAVLGRDAHTLLSVSGSLGFFELSQRCIEMEQACKGDGDLGPFLEATRRAAARAVAAIDDLTGRT